MINVKIVKSYVEINVNKSDYDFVFVFDQEPEAEYRNEVVRKLPSQKKMQSAKILTIIRLNNNFKHLKNIVLTLRKMTEKSDASVTYYLIVNDSKYLQDFILCLEAMQIKDRKEKYEYLYDKTCEYLDEQFSKYNYCDFNHDKCIANRNGTCRYQEMGCCHSFKLSKFIPGMLTNERVCQYLSNKKCSTKNISCKLHCCGYLREKGIRFKTHEMLALECFFNQKQHDIINLNF